jgi:ubiquinone/menaquinone biosynthesis C-methylase UbiE
MSDLPEHVLKNRVFWDEQMAAKFVAGGERGWAENSPTWGIWNVPESKLHLLPDDMTGLDAIELGCGTAYVSAWMARRGARVVAIDNSAQQLATARRLQQQHGLDFPLIHGNAESVPYPDSSFDFAISEYGACLWADPLLWIPEAARLLRPGGQLVFLTNSYLATLCAPPEDDAVVTDRFVRPVSAMNRIEWPGNQGVEFHLPHGEWIKLFHRTGFEIDDLFELMAGPDAAGTKYTITAEWAKQWPSEEVWKLRKRA